jgi:dipeptidyl aminopeptidase/acylaminoacyl peptidase
MAAGNYAQPVFIDDRRFIYFARDPRAPGTLQVGSLDGPITGNGLPAAKGGTYTSGFLVYATQPGSAPPAQNTAAQSGVLNAIRFDPKNLVTSGAPIILAEKVGLERRLPGIAAVTASASGSIAYRENAVMDRQMVWMDRNGDLVGTVGTMDSATPSLPRVSPDGRSILFVRQVGASIGSTWALDAANGAIRQLLDASNVALWSSNGDSILFATLRNRNNTASGTLLLERPLTASAGGTQFGPADTAIFPQDWAANGAVLYMTGTSVVGSGSGDLMVLPAPRATPVTVAQTPASERNGRFSSDGRWIAYQSDQTGRNEIYVQPFPGTIDQRQRVSLNGGTSPQWGRKGRELYFMSADNHLMVAAANPTSEKGSLEFNTPKQLFRSPLPQGTEYDTTLDGDRFLILSPAGEPPPIIVLSNWIPER